MRNMIGISGRMFTTLGQGNVNIEMISQGANEINISCVIDGRDAVKALNLIHQSCLQIKPEGERGRGMCLKLERRLTGTNPDGPSPRQWAHGSFDVGQTPHDPTLYSYTRSRSRGCSRKKLQSDCILFPHGTLRERPRTAR